jgi:hypothetical protein
MKLLQIILVSITILFLLLLGYIFIFYDYPQQYKFELSIIMIVIAVCTLLLIIVSAIFMKNKWYIGRPDIIKLLAAIIFIYFTNKHLFVESLRGFNTYTISLIIFSLIVLLSPFLRYRA